MVKKLLIINLLFAFGCSSRMKIYSNYFLKTEDMNFDITGFKDHEKSGIADYTEDDGSKVKSTIFNTGRVISATIKPDSPFTEVKEYYANLKLKRIQLFLNGLVVGMSYEYDENGKLIKTIDYDHLFKLTVEDLTTLLKSKFQINLSTPQQSLWVTRSYSDNNAQPRYSIMLELPDRSDRVIIIDGETGAILKDSKLPPPLD